MGLHTSRHYFFHHKRGFWVVVSHRRPIPNIRIMSLFIRRLIIDMDYWLYLLPGIRVRKGELGGRRESRVSCHVISLLFLRGVGVWTYKVPNVGKLQMTSLDIQVIFFLISWINIIVMHTTWRMRHRLGEFFGINKFSVTFVVERGALNLIEIRIVILLSWLNAKILGTHRRVHLRIVPSKFRIIELQGWKHFGEALTVPRNSLPIRFLLRQFLPRRVIGSEPFKIRQVLFTRQTICGSKSLLGKRTVILSWLRYLNQSEYLWLLFTDQREFFGCILTTCISSIEALTMLSNSIN